MSAAPVPPLSSRRSFLQRTAAAASAVVAGGGGGGGLGWAAAGAPTHLSAARRSDGAFALYGLDHGGSTLFEIPLPGRGHAAATHPSAPLAVAFARRPGDFALVVDCAEGTEVARLTAPSGRRFYGHGAFDPTGARLFTTENAYEQGAGRVGVWDVAAGFRRVDEWPSLGVGPHELVIDPDRGRILVANGGIRTHPASGRAKLNLPEMRPALAALDLSTGAPLGATAAPPAYRMNSLRHLAVRSDGLAAAAAQWEGDPALAPPLLALHAPGAPALRFLAADPPEQQRLNGYAGSVAFSRSGEFVAFTAPRGGRVHIFDAETGGLAARHAIADVCGLAAADIADFIATDGYGGVWAIDADGPSRRMAGHAVAWDNHLTRL